MGYHALDWEWVRFATVRGGNHDVAHLAVSTRDGRDGVVLAKRVCATHMSIAKVLGKSPMDRCKQCLSLLRRMPVQKGYRRIVIYMPGYGGTKGQVTGYLHPSLPDGLAVGRVQNEWCLIHTVTGLTVYRFPNPMSRDYVTKLCGDVSLEVEVPWRAITLDGEVSPRNPRHHVMQKAVQFRDRLRLKVTT